jgi:magnesium chelatase subunit I
LFPDPEKSKKAKQVNPYAEIISWFNEGNAVELHALCNQIQYQQSLAKVEGLSQLVEKVLGKLDPASKFLMMELVLHGLAEYSQLSKHQIDKGIAFKDLMSGMFDLKQNREED